MITECTQNILFSHKKRPLSLIMFSFINYPGFQVNNGKVCKKSAKFCSLNNKILYSRFHSLIIKLPSQKDIATF